MLRGVRLGMIAVVGLVLAACSAGTPPHPSARSPHHATSPTVTTQGPSTGVPATVPSASSCSGGTVTAAEANPGELTPVCVTVGSHVMLTGGNAMSGGTWPGPPRVSDQRVLKLLASSHAGARFSASFTALRAGTASVTVPFVAGPDVCNPTPCTPVPGAPLNFEVTVVTRA